MQLGLFPKRISTVYPGKPNGADIVFMGEAAEGGTYFCKADQSGRLVRLTEWLCTRIAAHLGIATADCAVMELDGETFFGSKNHHSTAAHFATNDFLRRPQKNELGQISDWPGRYFSGLYAVDMLLSNQDRDFTNFVMYREGSGYRVCAIDFAAAQLADLTSARFPVASSRTVLVGRILRTLHGFFEDSALEMIDRAAAVPRDVVAGFLAEIPADWANATQKEGVCDAWSGRGFGERLAALRSGLKDGTLL